MLHVFCLTSDYWGWGTSEAESGLFESARKRIWNPSGGDWATPGEARGAGQPATCGHWPGEGGEAWRDIVRENWEEILVWYKTYGRGSMVTFVSDHVFEYFIHIISCGFSSLDSSNQLYRLNKTVLRMPPLSSIRQTTRWGLYQYSCKSLPQCDVWCGQSCDEALMNERMNESKYFRRDE